MTAEEERHKPDRSGSFGERWRRSLSSLSGGGRRSSAADAAAAGDGGPDDGGDPPPGGKSPDASDLLNEADREGSAILLRRPDQISLSYRDESIPEGGGVLDGLMLSSAERGVVRIDGIRQGPLTTPGVNPCALLEGSRQSLTYLDVGDVVEYACGVDCRDGRTNASVAVDESKGDGEHRGDNIQIALDQSCRDATSELLEKIQALQQCEECGCDTTVCVSTTKSLKDPIQLCQAVVLFSKKYVEEELSKLQKGNAEKVVDEATTMQNDKAKKDCDETSSCFDFGMTFAQRDDRLVVESISKGKDSWFGSSGCAVREGDVVVGINEYISSTWSPEDANSFVCDVLSHPTVSQLSITTIAPSRSDGSKWRRIRRAAVATGGGTLVTAGAILMATPLHPVGHAMAIGGVAALGTEFEAPRRAMSGAKERFLEKKKSWSERRRSRGENGGEGGGPPDELGDEGEAEKGDPA